MDVFLLSEGTKDRASKVPCVPSFPSSCNIAFLLHCWPGLALMCDSWLGSNIQVHSTYSLETFF